jgi:hypothetical protein
VTHIATIDRVRGLNLLSEPGSSSYAIVYEQCWLALKFQSIIFSNLQESTRCHIQACSQIPVPLFEEHTHTCLELYQSQPVIHSGNEQFTERHQDFGVAFVQVQWLDLGEVGMKLLVPALHIYPLCG